jgi:TetR/AcrR family transcriptional regulator, transcriptional repressor for nem operon
VEQGMVERLIEKTAPAVQLAPTAQTKGEKTRERILDIAYESIVQKGFAATSIEELVEAAGITKSGFFYHFKDKNDLARQVFDRFLSEDEQIVERLVQRARDLSDDPLQSLLIFLNLYAQLMDDMESIHPGCMVASVTYQERLFDRDVRDMNTAYLTRMRARFETWLREIAAVTPPRLDTDLTALADQLTVVVEGAIILSKAFEEPALLGRQARLYRQHVKLLFGG